MNAMCWCNCLGSLGVLHLRPIDCTCRHGLAAGPQVASYALQPIQQRTPLLPQDRKSLLEKCARTSLNSKLVGAAAGVFLVRGCPAGLNRLHWSTAA